jgi:hypothetical protein
MPGRPSSPGSGSHQFRVGRLEGYIQNNFQDIDYITSLFREALASRPQGHPDHLPSIYHLLKALIWRYKKEPTAVYIHESQNCAASYCPSV